MPSLLFSSPSFPPVPFLVLLPPVCAPLNRVNDREREKGKPGVGLHHSLTYPKECLAIMQIFANERNRLCGAVCAEYRLSHKTGTWGFAKIRRRSSFLPDPFFHSSLQFVCARADCPPSPTSTATVRDHSHLGHATSNESSWSASSAAKDRSGTMEELPALSIVWRTVKEGSRENGDGGEEREARADMNTHCRRRVCIDLLHMLTSYSSNCR